MVGACSLPPSLPPSLLSLYLTLRPFIYCFVLTTSFLGKMYPHFTGKEMRLTEAPQLVSGRAFKTAFALWKLSFTSLLGTGPSESRHHCGVGFQPCLFPWGLHPSGEGQGGW